MATRNYYTSVVMGSTFTNTHSFETQPTVCQLTGATALGGASVGSSWAISLWFKFDPAFTSIHIPFFQSCSPGAGFFRFWMTSGSIVFEHIIVAVAPFQRRNQIRVLNGYRDGNWHHLSVIATAYSYDVNAIALYVDNVNVTSVQRNEINTTPAVWTPGATAQILPNSNAGAVLYDEIAVFNYAPSNSDLWNGGTPGNLNLLATPPINWLRGETNTLDNGSLADTLTESNPPVYYSTDVP